MKNNGLRSSRQSRIAMCALALALLAGMAWGYGDDPQWKIATRVDGKLEYQKRLPNGSLGHAGVAGDWGNVLESLPLRDGDRARTLEDSHARIRTLDHEVKMGPNTVVEIAQIQPFDPPWLVKIKQDCGKACSVVKKVLKGESLFEVKTTRAVLGSRGTEYVVRAGQKIAYVNGNDLWVMNDDGTGKTNYIAAPTGKKIGRSAFSPDGSQVVYEVWDCGGDRYPETSDLWIADGDGTNPQLLLSAGSLAENTERDGWAFKRRLLWGPCFSPDGSQVAFLRVQLHRRFEFDGMHLLDQEIGVVPAGGGSPQWLYATTDNLGSYTGSYPDSMAESWKHYLGMNACWAGDDRIYFRRSGRDQLYCWYGLSATGDPPWPFVIAMGSAHESDLAPHTLRATVDGADIDFLPSFKGFGKFKAAGSNVVWNPYPGEAWLNMKAGGAYGAATRMWSAGNHTLDVVGRTATVGGEKLAFQTNYNVSSGTVITANCQYYSKDGSMDQGVWSVPAAGGEPAHVADQPVCSVAWNNGGTQLAAGEIRENVHQFNVRLYTAAGESLNEFTIGEGSESYVGNWSLDDRWLIGWSGDDGVGSIQMLDVSSGDVTDLGPGEFPAFASLYYTVVSVSEGVVAVTDTNGQHEVLCTAGQAVSVDDLQNGGWPQAAGAVREPIVTNVIPAWGSAVPNDTPLAVRFQFNAPVATHTLRGCEVIGTSWPEQTNDWAADVAMQMRYLSETNDPARCFRVAVSNLASQGAGSGQWNAAGTEFVLAVTNATFSRTHGNACEISLELDGVETTNGDAFAFNEASTRFRFVDPIGSAGGGVGGGSGEGLTVPPGAVTQSVAFSSSVTRHPPAGGDSPTHTGWQQIGGCYTFGPVDQSLSSNVTLRLPVDHAYPGVAIWYFDGANWTNVGGTLDPTNGQVRVALAHLGSFCAFYQPPAGAWLQAIKTADVSSATNGQVVQFVVTVDNLGTETASNVLVVDALPAGLDCVTNNIGAGGTYDAETRTVAWTPGDLAGGSNHMAWFSATVATSVTYGAALTNVATVASDQTAATNSNARVVRVGLPAGTASVFGAGGLALTDWSNRVALGGGFVRAATLITTAQAQNTNLIDFVPFDGAVSNAQARGLDVYGLVDAASVGGVWPAAADFARAFGLHVERYDGDGLRDMPGLAGPVRHWEVFNEFQQDAAKWAGCTLAMYADYLSAAHATAHAADPATTILSSSFRGSSASTQYFEPLLTNYPWVASAIDAISFHDYWEATWYLDGTNRTVQYLESATLRDTLARLGLADREVWAVETDFAAWYDYWKSHGYTCSQTENAIALARAYPYALAAGIDHLIYTEFNHQPYFPEWVDWTVMMDSNGNRRMNFYVFQKMAERLEGFTAATLLDLGNADMGVKFRDASNQPVWVLWNWSNATRQVELPVGPVSQVRITSCLPATFDNSGATWPATTNELTNGAGFISVDGTPKYIEAVGWIDPDIDGDGTPNESDPDMDGDGMPNTYELAHGLNAFVADATADADEDGMPNGDEFCAGTHPQQETSVLECDSAAMAGSAVRVEWGSVSGKTYKVGWSLDLTNAWSNAVDGLIQATNSRTIWYDSGPPKTAPLTNLSPRYYRVGVLP